MNATLSLVGPDVFVLFIAAAAGIRQTGRPAPSTGPAPAARLPP